MRSSEDTLAWERFVELYTPLLFYWSRKTGLNANDAADLVQEVLAIVFQKLPSFQYDASRSFRGWLRIQLDPVTRAKFQTIDSKTK